MNLRRLELLAAACVMWAATGATLAIASAAEFTGTPSTLRGRTVVSNIHNAPGWRPAHAYSYATGPYTRVLNGPGWNESSRTYNPGQMLSAYQLISTGTCTSSVSGGPTGSGSAIRDGTCTWRYLSPVDYISITGWSHDAPTWKSGSYRFRTWVTSDTPLRSYTVDSLHGCTSTVTPTGTATPANPVFTTSDGCQWRYVSDVLYTSRRSYIPAQQLPDPPGSGLGLYNMKANYEGDVWNDREYVDGKNGELKTITLNAHFELNDGFSGREGNWWKGNVSPIAPAPPYHIILTTAPGESFADHAGPLGGYDPSKGAAIRNPNGLGMIIGDNFVDLIGLQIKSDNNAAIDHGWGWFGSIQRCILEGGSPTAAGGGTTTVYFGGLTLIANSLIISDGKLAITSKYPFTILHSTIINPDHVPNSVGIESNWVWAYTGITIADTAIFGFTHAIAHRDQATLGVRQPAIFWAADSTHNATDASATDNGGGADVTPIFPRIDIQPSPLPGANYSLPASDVFVKPGKDWRLKSGSPLIGAGRAYGTFGMNCIATVPNCSDKVVYSVDSPDIFGTLRPQRGRYDIGAWQSNGQQSR